MTDTINEVTLSPSQAIRLLGLSALVREGVMDFRCDDPKDRDNARSTVLDIGQEIALQIAGYGAGSAG